MTCPDREQLSRHLDGEEPHLEAHLRECHTCAGELTRLREVDGLLRRPGAGCPAPDAVLAALSGGADLTGCDPCASELEALRDVLGRHERNELERPSAGLRARLKRLAPAGQATAEELSPLAAPRPSTRSARRSAVLKVHSGTGRLTSGTGRLASGTGRTGSLRRRAVPPGARTLDRRGQPWIFAAMASAAALLFGMTLLLRGGPDAGGGQVALAPSAAREAARAGSRDDGRAPAARRPGKPFNLAGSRTPASGAPDPTAAHPAEAQPDESQELPVEADLHAPVPEPDRTPDLAVAPEPAAQPTEGPALASTAPARPATQDPDVGGHALPNGGSEGNAPLARPRATDDGGRLAVELARLVGAPQIQTEGGAWVALARSATTELRPGDRLRTGSRGAFLSLDGGAFELCLDAETELEVRGAASGPLLALDRGKLLADVATLLPGRRFRVETAQGEVEVLGTTFGLDARPDGTRLTVVEGTVAATSAAGQTEISAGYGAAFSRTRAPVAERADPRALAWTRDLAPRHEDLVAIDFDDKVLGGFDGQLTGEGALGGKGLSLLLGKIADNRYWGLRASAAEGRIGAFRAGADTWIQASVWSEEATEINLVVTNATQKKDFKLGFSLPARRWKTVHVPLMDLTTYFDAAKNPMREGDLLTGLDVFAGEPGASHRVLLDGVSVYRKIYR